MSDELTHISKTIAPVLEKYGVRSAGIFGSHARGDATPESDVDILVSLGEKKLSVWDMVGLREELSERLKKPVDLVFDKSIVSYFRDYIFRDLKMIYGTQR